MKKILLVVSLLCMALSLSAIPARPGKITHTQPDGTVITVEIHGDEYCHWVTDEAGNIVSLDADGYYRPVTTTPEMRRAARAAGESRRRQDAEARAAVRANAPVTGQKHYLVILIAFADRSFRVSSPKTAFTNLLNEVGYSRNGATGSARDYYYDNSNGLFEPVFDVVGPVTLDNDMAYYGADSGGTGNDIRAGRALYDACQKVDADVDFSRYDNDGDGNVDLVFFYYAGYSQAEGASSDAIWPHMSYLYGMNSRFDGVRVYNYACTSELKGVSGTTMCGIGAACHEFGHAMGLPDMYDTNYDTDGAAGGLYSYSIMCSGSYNNGSRTPPYFNMQERIFLGWNQESDIVEFATGGNYSIPALNGETQTVYKSPASTSGEYFMYECRARQGWDAYLPGEGLLVYHIDKSNRQVGWYTAANLWNWKSYGNMLNSNGSHPCCYLIPAASQSSLNYTGYESNIPFPYGYGWSAVDSYTPVDWAGETSTTTFEHIGYASGTVTLTANVPPDDISLLGYNFIDNPGSGTYSNNSRFYFNLVTAESNPPSSVAWYYDDVRKTSSYVTVRTGEHTVRAELTYDDGTTETLILEITVN